MPKVLNKYHLPEHKIPDNAAYCGRGSPVGNPFVIGVHGDRDQAIDMFEEYFMSNDNLIEYAQRELRGKDLVCYCAPKRCHCDIILKVANE